MQARTKKWGFGLALGVVGVWVAALSFYKIAIANAYRIFPDLPDVSERWLGDDALQTRTDAHQLERGRWLMSVIGCRDCHGPQLAGATLADDASWHLTAPPLAGPEARTPHFTGQDWRLALRFGVDAERRGLWGMPRRALLALRDQDVAAVAAAVRTAPAPQEPLPQLTHSRLYPRGYVAVATRSLWPLDRDTPAEAFARSDWQASIPGEDDAALGDYMAAVGHCETCHRHDAARRTSSVWASRRGPVLASVVGAADESDDARQARWQAHACTTRSAADTDGPPSIHRASLFTRRQQDELFMALRRLLASADAASGPRGPGASG